MLAFGGFGLCAVLTRLLGGFGLNYKPVHLPTSLRQHLMNDCFYFGVYFQHDVVVFGAYFHIFLEHFEFLSPGASES